MSNQPRNRPKPPKQVQRERPLGELKFRFVIAPPDGERDANDQPIKVELDVNLGEFSLSERQLTKQVLAKFATPIDPQDVCVVHAWVMWRRTHPTSSFQYWMDNITTSELFEAIALEPGQTQWDTTPEGYDPNL